MLISTFPPPLLPLSEGLASTAEICQRSDLSCLKSQGPMGSFGGSGNVGLGFVDPVTLTAAILGGGTALYSTFAAKKAADKQAKLDAAAIKAEKEKVAQALALAQAQLQAQPYSEERRDQMLVLAAVGVVAVGVAVMFLWSGIKARKG